jgi:predicted metal-dependent HD superfamily phosphohydrolase
VFQCRYAPYALPAQLAAELQAAYSEPHRAYHNIDHIASMLRWFDDVAHNVGWQQPADVYTAILFHDAVYVPGAHDNESRSAEWARHAIASHRLPANAAHVVELIELTAKHGKLEFAHGDAALFLDADLSILGSQLQAYRAYADQIRMEYSRVPANEYRAGRRAFIESFARKQRIYFTDYFHMLLDSPARANLADELSRL